MNSEKNRGIIFKIFVILFFVLTLTISLYASGYKLNLDNNGKISSFLQKTGDLVIDSNPSGALITLESKQGKVIKTDKKKTPNKIQRLLPGEYLIKLELDNYWSFEKKITIYPKQTTYLKDIMLFKQTLPLRISDASIETPVISPNEKYAVLKTDNILVNLKTEEKTSLPKINIQEISWNNNSRYLLTDKYIFDIENKDRVIYLTDLIGDNISKVKYGNDENQIYYVYNNQLNYFNLSSKINKNIVSENNILDYILDSNYLYLVSQEKKTLLKIYSLKNNKLETSIELPKATEYKLTKEKNGDINVYDSEHQNIYIIDELDIKTEIEGITQYIRINDNELLYTSNFEIYILDEKENKSRLITRISEPMNSIHLNTKNNYLIYSTDYDINIIEIDEDDNTKTTKLTELSKITETYFSEKNDTIYFIAKIGQQKGLYKLFIQ